MASGLTVPVSVVQNISRAKSLLKRDEPIRALDSLMLGLELYDPSKLFGKARFEAEVLIEECVTELNRQKDVKQFLEAISKSSKTTVAYVPGQEATLRKLLAILHKGLSEVATNKTQASAAEIQQRQETLKEKGKELLKQGDGPRAKATLRVLADEFGEAPGVLAEIGLWLNEAGYYFEALEFFEQAIEFFPKDSQSYAGATQCCMALHEPEKAVDIYLKAIKQFGSHPKTLVNLSKAYLMANNREKALEYALSACKADPENAEALELAQKLG